MLPSFTKNVLVLATVVGLAASPHVSQAQANPSAEASVTAMRKATQYMMDEVSYRDGFLWNYLPDLSRGWGEMEATRTMVWMQSPGTSTVGHMLLDAFHASGDHWFYEQAARVASTVLRAQHPSGGWHYLWNYAGEEETRKWYETVFAQGWRLEEFQHYYGNATFDDGVTTEAATFLLRMYLAEHDTRYLRGVRKAASFIQRAQYESGGWPQRFPFAEPFSFKGKPDYTRYITLNDNVAQENIQFLIEVNRTLGWTRTAQSIERAMDVFLALQGPEGQPAYALQYTPELEPIGARTYEPDSFATHTTQGAVQNLLTFYELTADPKYLEPIDAAIEWLERVRLPDNYPNKPADRSHATFIEFETDNPIWVKRRGTNIINGEYFPEVDTQWNEWPDGQDATQTPSANAITHYNSWRAIDVVALRDRKAALLAKTPEELKAASPLYADTIELPSYFSFKDIELSDIISGASGMPTGDVAADAQSAIDEITAADYWAAGTATPNEISNPYIGAGPSTYQGDPLQFSQTKVGDQWDTSPYDNKEVEVISTRQYISKMGILMRHIVNLQSAPPPAP